MTYMDLLYTYSVTDSEGNTLIPSNTLTKTAYEKRTESVELINESYTLDLTKYANINFIHITAKYNENSITPTTVNLGDSADFTLDIDAAGAIGHKGYFIQFPTTAPTSIVIASAETRKVLFDIILITES